MVKYRILSLDGGGIRGLITAILLERLEAQVPGFLSKIDLFAGTSTGGILALGLASGKTPTEAAQLYTVYGSKVFADSLFDEIRDLGTLIGADYSIEPLKEALTEQFGGQKLDDLPKKVLISAFDLDNNEQDPAKLRTWKAKFFHNYPGPDSDGMNSVVDVALYTAAAPTYFPIYQGFIDGGVVAANPSVCGLAQALHAPTGGQKLADIVLLSLGTGHNPRFLEVQDGDWGLVQWAPHMVNLALEGSSNLADYQCRQILGPRYHRANPILPYPISMDRYDKMPLMTQVANEFDLSDTIAWLKRYF